MKKLKNIEITINGKKKKALYIRRIKHSDWDAVHKKKMPPKEYIEAIIIPKYRKDKQRIFIPIEQFRKENPEVMI